jgi:hypothetical protein
MPRAIAGLNQEGRAVRLRIVFAIGVLLAGSAFAKKPGLREIVDSLKGGSIPNAIQTLGIPTEKSNMGAFDVYTWKIEHVYVMGPENLSCKIKLMVNQEGIVADDEIDGNNGACTVMLNRIRARQKAKGN